MHEMQLFNLISPVINITFCLTESIYSHSFMVDGRETTLNIWDSPYSEVRINLNCSVLNWFNYWWSIMFRCCTLSRKKIAKVTKVHAINSVE